MEPEKEDLSIAFSQRKRKEEIKIVGYLATFNVGIFYQINFNSNLSLTFDRISGNKE